MNTQKAPQAPQVIVKLQQRDGQYGNYFAYGGFERMMEKHRLVHKIDFGPEACILVFEPKEAPYSAMQEILATLGRALA